MAGARQYDVIVIGGGHAGAEAAWAAANMLAARSAQPAVPTAGSGHHPPKPAVETAGPRKDAAGSPPSTEGCRVALLTMDPAKIGAMSCNPAIGGLAKGQMVREIDAMGGLMGLAADATGIQFKVLNASKGPAVRGPRCQSDKYAYAAEVQRLLRTRPNLDILAGTVERLLVDDGRCTGVTYKPAEPSDGCCGEFGCIDTYGKPLTLGAHAVVLTTGTFMRGLMHTGPAQTPGGRVGEGPATTISDTLRDLGFELGRLKTGTPPRLDGRTIDYSALEEAPGDDDPVPFSELSGTGDVVSGMSERGASDIPDTRYHIPHELIRTVERFPLLPQVLCHITHTGPAAHDAIRANLDRAPMYNGQIETAGPRYCPSIEDKVVRFADKTSHHVFLEPESLSTHEVYCNGISTSLPADVQQTIVHSLPGCENATILRFGYAVEYDMVLPHQIDTTCMTKRIPGLFLAGQINGTSGYEEAAGQGLIAGINAVRWSRATHECSRAPHEAPHAHAGPAAAGVMKSFEPFRLSRDQAYIGVMLDDLVTKTPREPYRMFTSRAEHRLLLRSDNADARLTPLARELGLVDDVRWSVYQAKRALLDDLNAWIETQDLGKWIKSAQTTPEDVVARFAHSRVATRPRSGSTTEEPGSRSDPAIAPHDDVLLKRTVIHLLAEHQYAGYIDRDRRQQAKLADEESRPLPAGYDYTAVHGLRAEAAATLSRFQPATLGQARRLAGVNPADLMLVSVAMARQAADGSP